MRMPVSRLFRYGMALALFACVPCVSAAPSVYPVPQQVRFSDKTVQKTGKPVVIMRSGKNKNNKVFADLPKKSGAYKLHISSKGKVSIAAHDARGVFYAKQTLEQLTDKNAAGEQVLPVGTVIDWPDIEFRGTVEGFYGTPWSHEARLSQLRFYGRNKMNTYIYGPKDDPYHSSPHWRDPYPEQEAQQIKELVKVAKENHVDFVWAIHPGKDIKWTEQDMNNVIKKFDAMYNLGVRSFAVFFDDIFGEGKRGDMQAKLLNKINTEFVKKKGDVTPLIMCPTEYNKDWANKKPGTYLDILGDRLDPSIHVMWTGDSVCHDITLDGQQWVNKRIKRPSYVWWNWPVTDYCRAHLCMGRTYGLATDEQAKKEMGGFVSNPMDKPEASKVALFGVADYAWNMGAFDSDASWKAGVERLFPQAAKEMQLFVDHNSDMGQNGHGYRREESVRIAPVLNRALAAVKAGQEIAAADFDVLSTEFDNMMAAAPVIREKTDNPRLLQEIGAWVDSFEQLGNAGQQALKALQGKNAQTVAKHLIQATQALAMMDGISRAHNQEGQLYRSNVATGSLVLTPAVNGLVDHVAHTVLPAIAGTAAISPKPIVQGGKEAGLEHMLDGDRNSFWHAGVYSKAGDWYGVDYGKSIPVRNVELLMGRNDKDTDFVAKGQLEGTQDMKSWQPLGPVTSGKHVSWYAEQPVNLRAIRYRVIEPGKVNNGNTVWTAIREFGVNTPAAAKASTNVAGLQGIHAMESDKIVQINRVMETHKIKPGEFISLDLATPTDATWLEINLERGDLNSWAQVEVSVAGKEQPIVQHLDRQGNKFIVRGNQLPKAITGMKLVNKSNKEQDIALTMFKFDVPPADPGTNVNVLSDKNLKTVYRADKALDVTVPNMLGAQANQVVVAGTAAFAIQAQTEQGTRVPLGDYHGGAGVARFDLPAGTIAVRLTYGTPQVGQIINEVIFTAKK